MTFATLLLSWILADSLAAPGLAFTDAGSCPTSPVTEDVAPPDPNAAPVGPAAWYMNADRTIWAGPVPAGGWRPGGKLYAGNRVLKGLKTYWVRPEGETLVISGRRIDASAPPLEAHVPCCYPTGFQIVGLHFPTGGCWEVSARAGESELRFVTRVASANPAHAQ